MNLSLVFEKGEALNGNEGEVAEFAGQEIVNGFELTVDFSHLKMCLIKLDKVLGSFIVPALSNSNKKTLPSSSRAAS